MDATYLAEKLHFKPRMIYKLTQQLLDNKEIIQVSKSYNGKGFNKQAYSKLYQLDKDIIENYLLLLKLKYQKAINQVALLSATTNLFLTPSQESFTFSRMA
ncbi:hypothetical protein AGMMS49579_25180 [Spirochaetia bacterium]|nr:hypothetical protein AGMMS49579_25180 [Spirochaetia bacterium]